MILKISYIFVIHYRTQKTARTPLFHVKELSQRFSTYGGEVEHPGRLRLNTFVALG